VQQGMHRHFKSAYVLEAICCACHCKWHGEHVHEDFMSAEERAFLRAGVLDGTFLWEWNCPRCRYVLGGYVLLREPERDEEKKQEQQQKRAWHCSICNKSGLGGNGGMKRHRCTEEVMAQRQKYACPTCGKLFDDKYSGLRHTSKFCKAVQNTGVAALSNALGSPVLATPVRTVVSAETAASPEA